MATMIIKPRKVFPLIFMAVFVAIVLLLFWPLELFLLFMLGVMCLLFTAFFIDTHSGYLKLDEGLLTRKSLLSNKRIKISDIREVNINGSGVFPTSSLSGGIIELGNAKDGYVGIKVGAFKRDELTSLIGELHNDLKRVNPKRAQELHKALLT